MASPRRIATTPPVSYMFAGEPVIELPGLSFEDSFALAATTSFSKTKLILYKLIRAQIHNERLAFHIAAHIRGFINLGKEYTAQNMRLTFPRSPYDQDFRDLSLRTTTIRLGMCICQIGGAAEQAQADAAFNAITHRINDLRASVKDMQKLIAYKETLVSRKVQKLANDTNWQWRAINHEFPMEAAQAQLRIQELNPLKTEEFLPDREVGWRHRWGSRFIHAVKNKLLHRN